MWGSRENWELGEVHPASFWGGKSSQQRLAFLDPFWTHTKIRGHCQATQTWAQGATGPLLCACPD